MKNRKPVLLVEDDVVDAMTVKRAFKDLRIVNRLDTVENGEAALSYLRNPENEIPCIILLDMNLPKMNGIEFLKIAKHDKNLRKIPVVVLTSSEEEQDKVDSFDLSIAGYMVKPVDYMTFVEVVKTIDVYWTLSRLPEE